MNSILALLEGHSIDSYESVKAICGVFNKLDVHVSYDLKKRIILLSVFRGKLFSYAPEKDLIKYNGILLTDMGGVWKVLVVPPKALITKRHKLRWLNISKIEDVQKVVSARDGTTVTLYYHMDAWRMATSKGIDVTQNKIYGRTFQELFDESVSAAYDAEDSTLNFYDVLDKTTCYTFGFTHAHSHPYHRFITTQPQLWFLQSVKTDAIESSDAPEVSYDSPIDVDNNTIINHEGYKNITSIPLGEYGIIVHIKYESYVIPYFIESDRMKYIRETWYTKIPALSDELNKSRDVHELFSYLCDQRRAKKFNADINYSWFLVEVDELISRKDKSSLPVKVKVAIEIIMHNIKDGFGLNNRLYINNLCRLFYHMHVDSTETDLEPTKKSEEPLSWADDV